MCLETGANPDRTLVQILNVVEGWLESDGRPATTVEIDERSYVLGGSNGAAAVG